jgi:hypothetical protein
MGKGQKTGAAAIQSTTTTTNHWEGNFSKTDLQNLRFPASQAELGGCLARHAEQQQGRRVLLLASLAARW